MTRLARSVVIAISVSLLYTAAVHASNLGWLHIDQVAPDSRTFITATLLPTYCGARIGVPSEVPTGPPVCTQLTFSQPTADALAFASADMTQQLQSFPSSKDLSIRVGDGAGRFWAMLSITNNDTQEVTIVTPH